VIAGAITLIAHAISVTRNIHRRFSSKAALSIDDRRPPLRPLSREATTDELDVLGWST
jgi:hypothetical protein